MKRVNKSLIGHYSYYGVPTNVQQLRNFVRIVEKIVFKVLNKRSQRKSYTWDEFRDKILGNFPLANPRVYVRV